MQTLESLTVLALFALFALKVAGLYVAAAFVARCGRRAHRNARIRRGDLG